MRQGQGTDDKLPERKRDDLLLLRVWSAVVVVVVGGDGVSCRR